MTTYKCKQCGDLGNMLAVRVCAAHNYFYCRLCPPIVCTCPAGEAAYPGRLAALASGRQMTLDAAATAKREGVSTAEGAFFNFVDGLGKHCHGVND